MALRLFFALLVILFSLALTPLPVPAGEASNLLDGKRFVGLNGEKDKKLDPDEHEEIVFAEGRFVSTTCNRYNFADAPYSARQVGDSIHFEAVTHSPTHGKIAWQGVVTGDRAEMTFVWTKERWYWDIHREYWFAGSLAP